MKSLKTLSLRARGKASAAILASAMSLTACVSPIAGPHGNYATPIGNAPVTAKGCTPDAFNLSRQFAPL